MKILVTGGCGNIGISTLHELLNKSHDVSVFDLKTPQNIKMVKQFKDRLKNVIFGDLTNYDDIKSAMSDIDAVIHLGAIIPPFSEKNSKMSDKVNIDGTRNIIRAIEELNSSAKIVFASSCGVYGNTQREDPPVRTNHSLKESDHYSRQKIQCERLLQESKVHHAILRVAAVPPIAMGSFDPLILNYNSSNRIEFLHTSDAGAAFANMADLMASDQLHENVILNIAGGEQNGCRMTYSEMINTMFLGLGLKPFSNSLFGDKEYYTDWLDTQESQKLLKYQNSGLDQFISDLKKKLGWKVFFIRIFSDIISLFIMKKINQNKNEVI